MRHDDESWREKTQARLEAARARIDGPDDPLVARARSWYAHRDLPAAAAELELPLRRPFEAILSGDGARESTEADYAAVAVAEALAIELVHRDARLELLADVTRFAVGLGDVHFRDAFPRRVEEQPAHKWRALLTSAPTDPLAWLNPWDRRSGAAQQAQEAAARTFPRPPAGLLHDLHTRVSFSPIGILHLDLARRLDARLAAELICGLPYDEMAREGCRWLMNWSVDVHALLRAVSPPACGLLLAAIAGDLDLDLQQRAPRAMTPRPMTIVDAEAHELYRQAVEVDYVAQYADVATLLTERQDDGRMLGPWLAYLAQRRGGLSVTGAHVLPEQTFAPLRSTARVFAERRRAVSFAGVETTPASLLAQAAVIEAGSDAHTAESIWDSWAGLLASASETLRFVDDAAWHVMGWILAQCTEPYDTWRRMAKRIQPKARAYERSPWDAIDVMPSAVMSAVFAACEMESAGRTLWHAAFEMAVRHFLVVGRYRRDEAAQWLPAWTCIGFRRVFGQDDTELAALLARMPTRDLVKKAQELTDTVQPTLKARC